jgi:DNA-binding response OmpR family regulator
MTLRILIVEDEMMIAMLVEDMLLDLGHETVGPAAKLDAGMKLATSEVLDLAILDVNLGGARSYPIADLLVARGVPVVFATGYGAAGLDPQYAGTPVITKPFHMEALAKTIETARSAKEDSSSRRT